MPDCAATTSADEALLSLLKRLDALGYDFVTPTPASHARVLARPAMAEARSVRDVLGWSLPFREDVLPRDLFADLRAAGMLAPADGGLWRSAVRVSRVRGLLFLHSAYPTDDEDSVFLGPDSYRFADFVAAEMGPDCRLGRMVDIGGGAGVGALTAARVCRAREVLLTDVNRQALRLARINAVHAGIPLATREAPDLDGAPDACDLILANPPYIVDPAGRTYRDGGDLHGGEVSLQWAKAAMPKLAPGGRFLLYTGSAILAGGRDRLREELAKAAGAAGCAFAYRELDPDVFGEELEKPAYADVERIAVVGCTITNPFPQPPES
ncbi:methyltransferase [Phenylobacterium sp. J367]|uniref:methyltransferase n=1 Tax=Phenylobacterium sp. J367 TaxID=2898435 RepID=UPI002151FA62|nr:methyltransferase [Phenylobacterium sp. J367]MCR5880857.1 methyltransferase [Phenylobacterium sp. J367]